VLALTGRADGLHAGRGLEERAGREPGRQRARTPVHATLALCRLSRAERLAGGALPRQARASAHPEHSDKTIWEIFEAEQASLIEYRGPFDGFREIQVAVSKSSLVRFDHNRYSVTAKAARPTAQLRVYAERVVVWCDGEIVGEHARRFGRRQTAYDPWH
jgi:Mu transposase-like protein